MKTKPLVSLLALLSLLHGSGTAAPLGTAFTYQGRLTDSGNSASGIFDFRFAIYDAAENGAPVGATVTNTAAGITNGLFTVTLDFGSSVFSGDARWLEIAVRTNGGGAFTPLTPRQPLSPAPYALYAPSAGLAATATTAGTASSVVAGSIGTDALTPGAVDSSRIAGGGIAASNLNAAVLSNTFWRLDGNAGSTPDVNFLGTTDNQPLHLNVNGAGALRLEPTTNAPNVIGGSSGNYIASGVVGAAIAGGGNPATPSSNRIAGSWSFIGGGTANEVGSPRSVVAGGVGNVIEGGSTGVAIGGGSQNLVQSNSLNAHIGGGSHNTIQSNASVATIGGGGYNLVRSNATAATIPGGFENEVAGSYGFAAGRRAKADHPGAFVWADSTLTPAGFPSTGSNQFLIRAGGGVGIGTNNPQSALHVAGTVTASAFVGRGALPWLEVTGTSQSASPNVAYLANSATQVVVTLPVAPAVGDIVRVSGLGAGGWRIAQNDGQSILTENIGGIGTVWTPHESNRMWSCVASSTDGTRLAAAVNDSLEGRIYLSADSGASWIASGPTQAWLSVACSADGAKLVAIPWYGQLHTSDDYGTNWTARDIVREWRCVASSANGNKLIAVPNASFILTSTNAGVSWTPIETNAWWNSVALSADGNIIYAAGSGPIYMSFDFGANWYAPGEWNSWSDIACSADGSQVFASAMYLYSSTNYGFGWTAHGDNGSYRALACSADGTRAVAVDGVGRIYTSADSGLTWTRRLDGMYNWWTVASSADGSKLVATGNGMQIYTSVPTTTPGTAGYLAGGQGSEVQLQYLGNGQFRILNSEGDINVQGSVLATGFGGVQDSVQNLQVGLDTKVSKGGDTMTGPLFNYVAFSGNGGGLTNLNTASLAGTIQANQLASNLTLNGTVTAETFQGNGAMPWQVATGTTVQAMSSAGYLVTNTDAQVTITLPTSPNIGDVVRVSAADAACWKIAQNAGQAIRLGHLPTTLSRGVTWTACESNRDWRAVASSSDGNKLVAVVPGGGGDIYTSTDSGATWVARGLDGAWMSVASSADGINLVAGGLAIYVSKNSGGTWGESNPYAGDYRSVASSADGRTLVGADYGGEIHSSTNSGGTWLRAGGIRNWVGVASSADGSKLAAVVSGGQIYTSTDSGRHWTARDSSRSWLSVASSADGTRLVAGVWNGPVYTSADSGITWTARGGGANYRLKSIASSSDGVKLVGVEPDYIRTSTDSGVTWRTHDYHGLELVSVASSADGNKLVAVDDGGKIYTSEPSAVTLSSTTTPGLTGSLEGAEGTAIELQYIGNNLFLPLSHEGPLFAY